LLEDEEGGGAWRSGGRGLRWLMLMMMMKMMKMMGRALLSALTCGGAGPLPGR
jgi:hypothetical protein